MLIFTMHSFYEKVDISTDYGIIMQMPINKFVLIKDLLNDYKATFILLSSLGTEYS